MNGRASSSSFSATTKTIRGAATKTMETIGRVAVEAHGLGQSLVGETVAMLERATVRGTPVTTPADAERDETLADMSEVLDGSASPSTTSVDGRCREYTADAVHATPPAHATAMTTEEQIEAQGFRCRGCGARIDDESPSWLARAFRPFRHHQRCEYDGFVYCDACAPATSFAPIPWRILRDFDFRPRRVAERSRRFLASIDAAPIFNLGVINPRLFNRPFVAELRDARVRARAEIEAARRRVSRASLEAALAETPSSPSTRVSSASSTATSTPNSSLWTYCETFRNTNISPSRASIASPRRARAPDASRARRASAMAHPTQLYIMIRNFLILLGRRRHRARRRSGPSLCGA